MPSLPTDASRPTSGLDPLMKVVFQHEIARVRDAGATVLLSSHILSEVEQLCDRVSIIRAGKIVESGTLAELRHLTRTEVSFTADADSPTGSIEALARIPGAHDVRVDDGRARLTVESDAVTATLPALGTLGVPSSPNDSVSRPLRYASLADHMDRIVDENTDAPLSVARPGHRGLPAIPRRSRALFGR